MHVLTHAIELNQLAEECPAESWLSNAEWTHYVDLPSNRSTLAWLGGRWCAKQLLQKLPNCQRMGLSDIHIESRNGLRQGIAPRILIQGRLQPWKLTISHGDYICAAAISLDLSTSLGLDIVNLESDCTRIERMWLTPREAAWCDASSGDGVIPAIVWALKEAIYKSIGNNARFQPRKLDTSRWFRLEHMQQIAGSIASHSTGMNFGVNNRMPIDGLGIIHWEHFDRELLLLVEPSTDGELSNLAFNSKNNSAVHKHLRREAILQ